MHDFAHWSWSLHSVSLQAVHVCPAFLQCSAQLPMLPSLQHSAPQVFMQAACASAGGVCWPMMNSVKSRTANSANSVRIRDCMTAPLLVSEESITGRNSAGACTSKGADLDQQDAKPRQVRRGPHCRKVLRMARSGRVRRRNGCVRWGQRRELRWSKDRKLGRRAKRWLAHDLAGASTHSDGAHRRAAMVMRRG